MLSKTVRKQASARKIYGKRFQSTFSRSRLYVWKRLVVILHRPAPAILTPKWLFFYLKHCFQESQWPLISCGSCSKLNLMNGKKQTGHNNFKRTSSWHVLKIIFNGKFSRLAIVPSKFSWTYIGSREFPPRIHERFAPSTIMRITVSQS